MSKFEKATGLSFGETLTIVIQTIAWFVILYFGALLSN